MATCRDIVTGGLRLLGVYGGGDDPSDEDATMGLLALQGIFDAWVGSGMFGRLRDVYVTSNYTAKESERVTAANSAVVTLPTVIKDGCLTRTPRDLSLIEIYDGTNRKVWLYDRTGWVRIDALAATDPCPLSTRGARGLMAVLAVMVADDFERPIRPSIGRLSSQFRAQISLKLGSTQDPTPVDYF